METEIDVLLSKTKTLNDQASDTAEEEKEKVRKDSFEPPADAKGFIVTATRVIQNVSSALSSVISTFHRSHFQPASFL
jgi:hypothetical protein